MSLNKSQALNAANEYALQRNVQAAVAIYQQIIEADPTDLAVINTLGDLYAGAGRVQQALAQFSRVADGYIAGGFTRKAIATLTKTIALDPTNSESAMRLADLYAQAGLPSEARQHYLQIAETLTRKGQMLDALSVYGKVVDLDPLNTSTRIKLGELYLRERMNEQAFDAFVTAARQLTAKGENRRALNAYNEALAIRPDGEALAAARKLMTSLGVADQDERLRSPASQSATPGILASEHSSRPPGSDQRRASTPLDQGPQPSDSFVVQQISNAEILVAYGKVHQSISMLRDVLRDRVDNIDVHIKLKDIYLRTGMMAEAAHECVELERIHEARGESDRARDYAVRAGRLTQLIEHPSGDLAVPARIPVNEAEHRVNAAPVKVASSYDIAPKTRPVASRVNARPAQPMTISVVPSNSPAVEVPAMAEADLRPASLSSASEALAPIPAAMIERRLAPQPVVAQVTNQSTGASQRLWPVLFASSMPVEKKRSRLTAVAIAAGVVAILGASAVIGRFAYDARLDKQYQALALDAPALAAPAPPPAVEPEESQPVQELEPITVVVTPTSQAEPSPQRAIAESQPVKSEQRAAPEPASEPVRVITQPPPMPPRAAVSPDNRAGTENQTPVGVPGDVPVGPTHPAEPPPRAVRQSPEVVPGGAVRKVDPVYPSSARDARQMGVVAVEVTISAQGDVTSARALSGPALLRNAAVMAARAWKFKASTLGGVPVTTTTTIVFNFKL